MSHLQNKATGERAPLVLSGQLTVQEAGWLRGVLLNPLERLDRIEIDLSQATGIDLAGLQLLCAAHKSAMAQGKKIVLLGVPEPVAQAARGAGFSRLEGCTAGPGESCLWAQGGE
jgi:anti-anti-sigma regulatory factor